MAIEIKRWTDGKVIYIAEHAADVREAVIAAVKEKADLGYADLGYADLGYADLGYADLGYADLGYADLGYADLGYANLGYANLGYANLGSANLRYAKNVPATALLPIRQDFWDILDAAPAEVAGLRLALTEGRVDGSTYEGECRCLVGTIAKLRDVEYTELDGIAPDADRPAEVWFGPIGKGDTPEQEPEREGQYRAATAVAWIDEWRVSRVRLVEAFAGAS